MLRKNLRKFERFEFAADSDEYKKRLETTQKVDIAKLKALCDGLDIDKKGKSEILLFCLANNGNKITFDSRLIIGSKEELAARIFKFLLAPEGEGEPPAEDEEPEEEEDEEEEAASSEDDKKKKVGRKSGAKDDKVSKSGAGRPKRASTGRSQGIYASDTGIWFFLCREIKRILPED